MAERGIIFKDNVVHTPSKSWFDLSYDFLFSCNFGEIVPTTFLECMAEDVIHAKSDNFTRLAPMVAPAFGKVNMFSYHFYVRNRDVWKHWDSFITNSDQKESWQSQLSNKFAFVSPVMPYIDVRDILFGDRSFGTMFAQNTINSDTPQQYPSFEFDDTGHDNILDLYTDCIASQHARFLVIGVVGQRLCTYVVDSLDWIDCNTSTYWLVIPFIPNKDEYIVSGSNVKYYNPFSDGSLFDYLGLDLSGLYDQNRDWINQVINAAKTFYNDADVLDLLISDRYTESYEPDAHLTPSELYSVQPVALNLLDWVRTHAILGAYVLVNNQYKRVYGANTYGNSVIYSRANTSDDFALSSVPGAFTALCREEESSKISNLPLRAYYFIYSEYFRDQNYIDINENLDFTRDGLDIDWSLGSDVIFDFLTLKIKAWEHDCYTTALPGPQRGNAVRFIPDSPIVVKPTSSTYVSATRMTPGIIGSGDILNAVNSAASQPGYTTADIHVDLSAATIENFRFANATQKYLEKVARSGNRYYEYMKAIFGADIKDAKLDRPIFLQGDKTPIQVSEVLQTSASELTTDQPLGQMAGRAVAVGSDDYLQYVTPDNGFFVELCAILPRVSYQQGINSMFTRKVYLDFPLPDFAQLGEEQVKQQSLWYSADDNADNTPFGYQSRYWDFKYQRDRVSGQFKSSLDHWTWSRKFDDAPINGRKFIEVKPDYRQFAVADDRSEHVYTHMFHDIQVERSLPVFGIPSL